MIINGYDVKPFANLRGADLYGADLSGAYLYGANLRDVNLYGANLRGADLRGANLRGADLREVSLRGADLRGANLRKANLRGVSLRGADLRKANFFKVKNLNFQIPQEGDLIVYKKTTKGVVKLKVPASAKRTATPIGRKCRAEFVEVLEAPKGAFDMYSKKTEYVKGKIIYPDKYDPDWRIECTHGVHFFLTKEEAEQW